MRAEGDGEEALMVLLRSQVLNGPMIRQCCHYLKFVVFCFLKESKFRKKISLSLNMLSFCYVWKMSNVF